MSFFKKKVSIEDFCQDFYDNHIFSSTDGKDYYSSILSQFITEKVELIAINVDKQKLINELIALQIELLGLACTHKYVSGEIVIHQNFFTKSYLIENGKNEIWNSMYDYNDIIDIATLDWLTTLGKVNIVFNHNMRKDLVEKNIEDVKKLGLKDDEVVERINKQVWSENAWRQNFMQNSLGRTFWSHLGLELNKLDEKTSSFLAALPIRLYKEAQQYLKQVKIKN
ncbi:MAG: hypothetical protein COY66_01240 [Candidatus Kerfeldbacteria bacterium CG_4_10_14_0_8_um_filter_42_10]|uniref:Uncharacterized protein n=1 Tax=Candidatus Kerfeldbacteria bacterium CG_4_10_14_0_8_um_filter_42_10 TaxID=2014248 RepID=A0A2M7RK26_9BACT|nr:MAG: hypothetical protein COY66_01240 [Candidatus Kerfeldbacteria bacterium CG_4_10_14_0_8_um_filter_42_10]